MSEFTRADLEETRRRQDERWQQAKAQFDKEFGGVINVTREEFSDVLRIMRGEPGRSRDEAKAVCQRLGLELEAMAFKCWTVKVVDEVKQRCEPASVPKPRTNTDGH